MQWLRNFRLDKRGPLEDSDVKTRISDGPRVLNRTRCHLKNGHPTRRFLQSLSARKADSDTVPEVALRSSPSATERNGRHHGLRAGHQSPEANCRQFICFSPLLHRLPRQAPFLAAFDGRRAPGPGTTAGHHWSAWCYVTSTGRRVIKPVRRLHGLDSDEDWLPLHGGRYKPDSFLKDW